VIGWLRKLRTRLAGRPKMRPPTVPSTDMEKVLEEKRDAEGRLQDVEDRWNAVREVASDLRRQRIRNDFADRIYKAWGR